MNALKRIFNYIKNIFIRQKGIKKIGTSKNFETIKKESSLRENLKVTILQEKNDIETLVCEGDGLGIRKKISY